MPTIIQRRRARREILQTFDYLEEQASIEVAERFLTAVSDTIGVLASMPHLGARCDFQRPSLRRVRRWPVKGFENWLIFYLPRRDGVEIIHVIHGARNIAALLGE